MVARGVLPLAGRAGGPFALSIQHLLLALLVLRPCSQGNVTSPLRACSPERRHVRRGERQESDRREHTASMRHRLRPASLAALTPAAHTPPHTWDPAAPPLWVLARTRRSTMCGEARRGARPFGRRAVWSLSQCCRQSSLRAQVLRLAARSLARCRRSAWICSLVFSGMGTPSRRAQ